MLALSRQVSFGENCLVLDHIRIVGPGSLIVGDRVFVNRHVYFDTNATISIGSDVQVGDHVTFLTATHSIGGRDRRADAMITAPVTVGDGVWIGSGAVILPGVSIGDGVVVGAGAIVTRDLEPDGVYVGNPARRYRDLPS